MYIYYDKKTKEIVTNDCSYGIKHEMGAFSHPGFVQRCKTQMKQAT